MKPDTMQVLDDQNDEFVGVLTAQGVKQSIAEAIANLSAEQDPHPTVTHLIKTPEGDIIVQAEL